MSEMNKMKKAWLRFQIIKENLFRKGDSVTQEEFESSLYEGKDDRATTFKGSGGFIPLNDLSIRNDFLNHLTNNLANEDHINTLKSEDFPLPINGIYLNNKEFESKINIDEYRALVRKVNQPKQNKATRKEVELVHICEKYKIVFGTRKVEYEVDENGEFLYEHGHKKVKLKGGAKVVACTHLSYHLTKFDFDEICLVAPRVFEKWNNSSIDFLKSKNKSPEQNMVELLDLMENNEISDLHIHQYDDDFYTLGGRKHTKVVDLDNGNQAFLTSKKANEIFRQLKMAGNIDTDAKKFFEKALIAIQLSNGIKRNFRMSLIETISSVERGKSLSLRRLTREEEAKSLEELNYISLGINMMKAVLKKENDKDTGGMILISGPTNSGKSALLVALMIFIREVVRIRQLRIGNPIETTLRHIPATDFSLFADTDLELKDVLEAFLTHDPDAIIVEEAKSDEELKLCIDSALTGHLTAVTIHANSCEFAIKRFLDNPLIDKTTFNSVLELNINQRLILRPCRSCEDLDNEKALACEVCGGSRTSGVLPVFDNIQYLNVGIDDDILDTQKLLSEGKAIGISKEDCIRFFQERGLIDEKVQYVKTDAKEEEGVDFEEVVNSLKKNSNSGSSADGVAINLPRMEDVLREDEKVELNKIDSGVA